MWRNGDGRASIFVQTPARSRAYPVARTQETYDIRILRDGTWLHEGAPIQRPELVKLFARVLSRDEAGDYWLTTPAEHGRIAVEDAPFVAVEMTAQGQGRDQTLRFRTNVDDLVVAGPDHPITLGPDKAAGPDRAAGATEVKADGAAVPYLLVRGRLTARIGRNVYYELAALATDDGPEDASGAGPGVWSGGVFFPLMQAHP
jgi:uncharacterized protein